ncbi:hypothetical protein AZA_88275 [Nitrospirillum viridazoti Y2]|uniref:Amino acid ABC transporter substrate-binding protein (PAAT family) n=1 Tax=Nitrospirillum amazonense TaxID=28077 RepID=A0A560IDQ2_9PROT|nr:hypothetical protein [Nitrospirillum amazonense]EGY01955.1 hypothetical protein AZA_88275 [Nitrospirillum amazonense Y2]TWB56435.1 hypothetical protein FBZ92_11141 [Nitrospirillum amazonense]
MSHVRSAVRAWRLAAVAFVVLVCALAWNRRATAGAVESEASTPPLAIIYPRYVESGDDPRADYPLGLLRLALDKMGARYTLRPSDTLMERTRAVAALKAGAVINLAWVGSNAELERELRPIRIPIYRGLLGYRLFIIRKQDQARFTDVHTLDDLRRLTAGQGLGWTDVDIFQAAGLPVETFRYDLLFRLMQQGRLDYFPRSASEIYAELAAHSADCPDLTVEDSLLLVYRLPLYFFTSKKDEALAATIEEGLRRAYDDGSFLKYFNEHPAIRKLLAEAHLETRRRIDIPNPVQSPETAALPDKYWFGR